MDQKVFLFPIHNALTLMNIGLPYHIFEPRYRQMIRDSIRSGAPVAVTSPRADYRGHIFAAGVPEIIQGYEDGRMDIVIRGEIKGKLDDFVGENPYKVFTFHELKEDHRLTEHARFNFECLTEALTTWARKQISDGTQLDSFTTVIQDPVALASYATLFLIEDPHTRQAILELPSLEKKFETILHEWGPPELKLGPFLPPLKF